MENVLALFLLVAAFAFIRMLAERDVIEVQNDETLDKIEEDKVIDELADVCYKALKRMEEEE